MKMIQANPDFFQIIHSWAAANPIEFFFGMTVALMLVSHKLKDLF